MFKLKDIEKTNFEEFLYQVMMALAMRTRGIVGRSKIKLIARELIQEADSEMTIIEDDQEAEDALRYEFGNGQDDESWTYEYMDQFSAHNNHAKNLKRALDVVNNSIKNPLIELLLEKLR